MRKGAEAEDRKVKRDEDEVADILIISKATRKHQPNRAEAKPEKVGHGYIDYARQRSPLIGRRAKGYADCQGCCLGGRAKEAAPPAHPRLGETGVRPG